MARLLMPVSMPTGARGLFRQTGSPSRFTLTDSQSNSKDMETQTLPFGLTVIFMSFGC